MHLAGNVPTAELVTGVIMAVLGMENSAGEFVVEDYCFQDLAPQVAMVPGAASADDSYVCLISGLDVHDKHTESLLPLTMFLDFIAGRSGSPADQALAAKIARVVVAGNLVTPVDKKRVFVFRCLTVPCDYCYFCYYFYFYFYGRLHMSPTARRPTRQCTSSRTKKPKQCLT